ncbi:MAG: hypothetical protein QM754_15475 [Tepidisphaeraceae bacterium]
MGLRSVGRRRLHSHSDWGGGMVSINSSSPRQQFPLGRIVATTAALAALAASGDSAHALLTRHVTGDFGVVGKEDWQANDDAIASGERVFSAYLLKDGRTKVWVITESDRSATTMLLPDEY